LLKSFAVGFGRRFDVTDDVSIVLSVDDQFAIGAEIDRLAGRPTHREGFPAFVGFDVQIQIAVRQSDFMNAMNRSDEVTVA